MPILESSVLDLLPSGYIMRWQYSSPIPGGWQICDGTNDTPNLLKCFAVENGVDAGHASKTQDQSPAFQKIIFIMKS